MDYADFVHVLEIPNVVHNVQSQAKTQRLSTNNIDTTLSLAKMHLNAMSHAISIPNKKLITFGVEMASGNNFKSSRLFITNKSTKQKFTTVTTGTTVRLPGDFFYILKIKSLSYCKSFKTYMNNLKAIPCEVSST